jgi:hypothetical protein
MVLPPVRIDPLQVNMNPNFKAQRRILSGQIQNPTGKAVEAEAIGEKHIRFRNDRARTPREFN